MSRQNGANWRKRVLDVMQRIVKSTDKYLLSIVDYVREFLWQNDVVHIKGRLKQWGYLFHFILIRPVSSAI